MRGLFSFPAFTVYVTHGESFPSMNNPSFAADRPAGRAQFPFITAASTSPKTRGREAASLS